MSAIDRIKAMALIGAALEPLSDEDAGQVLALLSGSISHGEVLERLAHVESVIEEVAESVGNEKQAPRYLAG